MIFARKSCRKSDRDVTKKDLHVVMQFLAGGASPSPTVGITSIPHHFPTVTKNLVDRFFFHRYNKEKGLIL
jgi:hypothetical protein